MRRLMIVGAVVAALVALGGVSLMLTGPLMNQASASLPPARFVMTDQDGRTVREADLLKKPTVIFFGYTFCPDACPTTLARLEVLMKALGPQSNRLNVVFVTIDPARDTPHQLKQYLAAFDPRFIGLTGTPAQVALAAKEYGVFYQKAPLPGGGYSMDHSTAVYLVDRKRGFEQILAPDQAQADQLDALKHLLGLRRA